MSTRRLCWLIAAAFVLHELEEWNLVAWQAAHFEPAPAFDERGLRVLLVLIATLGFSFSALAIELLPERRALLVLLPLFVVVMLGNAFTHVFWLVAFRGYAPGVVTSALLLVPLIGLLVVRVVRERLAPRAYVYALVLLSLAAPIGAAAMGNTLSPGQLAVQAFGNRLAHALLGDA